MLPAMNEGSDQISAAKPHALTVRWERFAPSRKNLPLVFGGWALIGLATMAAMYALALAGANDIMIGGDFSAFHVAAKAAADGASAQIYEVSAFEARLMDAFPDRDDLGLSWQYPPTYFLLIIALAGLPYLLGFTLWSTATFAGFATVIRKQINEPLIWFGIIASPATLSAFITGQNGFLTAALLILASLNPKARPLLAGIAAGLLTVKPHLGLLIPIAYLAAGCWRAIGVAIVTSLVLAALSVGAFGMEPWSAFLGAVSEVSAKVSAQIMPLGKMTTPYAAALFAGLPVIIAQALYAVIAIGAGVFVWRVWRMVEDQGLRAAALIASALFAAPYGFHYELIILAFPCAIVAMRAIATGWLKHEKLLLSGAWVMPGAATAFSDLRQGLAVGFITVLIVFVMTARRIHAEHPALFPWTAPERITA